MELDHDYCKRDCHSVGPTQPQATEMLIATPLEDNVNYDTTTVTLPSLQKPASKPKV